MASSRIKHLTVKMNLNQCVKTVFIVYHNEDVTPLTRAMNNEGFDDVRPVKANYSKEESEYSRQSKCLLGHYNAWQHCKSINGLSIILEADFVPCRGFGSQPLPFDSDLIGSAWGWLYSCGSRVYEYDGKYIRGHSSTAVAYVLDGVAAAKVEGFVADEFSKNCPRDYFPWDTYMRVYAQQQGVPMYLVAKSYGEHGGIPNPEHKINSITQRHQADRLISPLHFMPLYARGSNLRYRLTRLKAYSKAWLRLLCGRYIERPTIFSSATSFSYKLRLLRMAIGRLL